MRDTIAGTAMLDRSHARTWMLLAAMLGAGCTEPPSPTYDEGTSSSGPTEGTTTLASGSTAALDESSGGVDGSSPDVGRDDDGGWPCSDEQDEWAAGL